jgi:hypothetical protein
MTPVAHVTPVKATKAKGPPAGFLPEKSLPAWFHPPSYPPPVGNAPDPPQHPPPMTAMTSVKAMTAPPLQMTAATNAAEQPVPPSFPPPVGDAPDPPQHPPPMTAVKAMKAPPQHPPPKATATSKTAGELGVPGLFARLKEAPVPFKPKSPSYQPPPVMNKTPPPPKSGPPPAGSCGTLEG